MAGPGPYNSPTSGKRPRDFDTENHSWGLARLRGQQSSKQGSPATLKSPTTKTQVYVQEKITFNSHHTMHLT